MKYDKIIIESILSCNFEKAYKLITNLSYTELENLLLIIGYDYGQSLFVYTFIEYLIQRQESIDLHFIAQSILCGPLCHIENAYNISIGHNYRILELDKNNLQAMLMMIFYSSVPDIVVNDNEIIYYAKEILRFDPDNHQAREYLIEHE